MLEVDSDAGGCPQGEVLLTCEKTDGNGYAVLAWNGDETEVYRAYSAERAVIETGGTLSSASEKGETPSARPQFEQVPHQLSSEPTAPRKNYLNTGNEDPEVRAIYLYKEGSSSLYRLRLE